MGQANCCTIVEDEKHEIFSLDREKNDNPNPNNMKGAMPRPSVGSVLTHHNLMSRNSSRSNFDPRGNTSLMLNSMRFEARDLKKFSMPTKPS
jgi:hypothetical protein